MRRLVIRPGAIGDFVVSLPALECLRTEYYEVWTSAVNVPLVRFADRVRAISSTGLDLVEITGPSPGLLETLRGFDSIVSWYGSNRPEFLDCARRLVLPLRFFPALPPENAACHAADFYLDQARTLAECACDGTPRIACEVARENFAVIQPFSGSPKKNWPLDRFRELARRMPLPVQWCAGPPEALEDAIRFDDLYELACWLATARLYIGNDSGITHLAAAVGTPVVALFGPADPAIWAPRGPRVQIVKSNLATISVEQVLSEASRMATLP